MPRGKAVFRKRKLTAVLLLVLWMITIFSGGFTVWAEDEEPGEDYILETEFEPGEDDELLEDEFFEEDRPADELPDGGEFDDFEIMELAEDIFPGMPESYILSADEIDDKRALVSEGVINGFADAVSGEDYVEGEVVFLADSEERALEVAAAYGAELKSFGVGVAVLELPEHATTFDALLYAADTENNLPAVYPNFIYTLPEVFEEEIRNSDSVGMGLFAADAPVKQTWKSSFTDPFLKNPDAGTDGYQWHHDAIGSYAAWSTTTGVGIIVAVLDTGIQSNHPDLIPVLAGYNGVNDNFDVNDVDSHGTHVAGIIGARANGIGGRGVAPGVSLLPVKVLGDDGNSTGTGTTSSIYRGIEWVVNRGGTRRADIINMSLGGYSDDIPYKKSLTDAINKGIVVVSTVGNDSTNIRKYPATLPGLICVASTDMNGMRSNFSNYGSWVTIAAPGSSILSTIPGSAYIVKSGTSMAAPIVSGCAALYISTLDAKPANAADVAKVKAALVKYAVKANSPQIGKIVNISGMFDSVLTTPVFAVKRGGSPVADVKSLIPADCIVTIQGKNFIVYTTDGSAPSVKDGVVTNGISLAADTTNINLDMLPEGKITIKALCVNGQGKVSKTAAFTVTTISALSANGANGGMSEISGSGRIGQGRQGSYSAVVTGAAPAGTNKTIEWSVSDASKATINDKGVLSIKPGTSGSVIVYARSKGASGGSVWASKTVEITPILMTSMSVTIPAGYKLGVAGTGADGLYSSFPLIQQANFSDGSNIPSLDGFVKWSSSNTKAVAVSQEGWVTAIGSGTATITAVSTDGTNIINKITITSVIPAMGVYISGNPIQLACGKSAALKATTYPAKPTAGGVIWSVDAASASAGIKITSSGKLTVPKNSVSMTIVVTATAKDGYGAKANVNVEVVDKAASSVKISTADISGRANDTLNVKTVELFTLNPPTVSAYDRVVGGASAVPTDVDETYIQLIGNAEGHAVSWSSGNTKVAMVDSSGRVTAIGPGKAVITCTASDGGGKKASCTVNAVIPASSVWVQGSRPLTSFSTPTLAFGKSLQMKASALAAYGKVTNTKVSWTYTLYKSDGNSNPAGSASLTGMIKLSSSGKLTLDKKLVDNWIGVMGYNAYIRVTATAMDCSGVSGYKDVFPCRGTDAMKFQYSSYNDKVGAYGKIYFTGRGLIGNKYYGNYYNDYIVTTSNSKVVTICDYGENYVEVWALSKGTAIIKVMSNDGTGKSVSAKITIKKS